MSTADDLSRPVVMKRIKKALEQRSGTTWSVTGGRGTAWGWLTIEAPPKRRTWRREDTGNAMTGPVYRDANTAEPGCGHMGPYDREQLGKLLGLGGPVHCQGVSVPSSSDHYREYIERAETGHASKIAQPYWD